MVAAILLALASGATWAIGMTAAKPALRHIDVLSYMWIRWLLVAPLALLFGLATGTLSFPSLYAVGMAALAGFLDSTIGGFLFLMAMERAPAYQTTTLASTAPVWGVATAILLLGEPLRWQALAAAGLVVVGAYVLMGHRLRIRSHLAGSLLGLAAGLVWGIAETIPTKLALEAGIPPASLLFVFACSGLVTILAMTPLLRVRIPRRVDRKGLAFTVLSGIGGAFVGWLFWLSALRIAPASVIAPVRGSTLVFAFVYALLFLKERPRMRAAVGVGLVFGAVLLVSTAG